MGLPAGAGASSAAPLPVNEWQRLSALRRYQILDTLPEQAFDDLAWLAAQICQTPIAAVSLVDAHRQWFKARVGIAQQATSRRVSFCAHAILRPNALLVVPDTLADDRCRDHPLVTGDPRIRFYAGAPLVMRDGMVLGTLCVLDTVPRDLTEHQRTALEVLCRSVVNEIELRAVASDSDARFTIIEAHYKTVQQELLELTQSLEARVKARTVEIQDLYDNAPTGYHSLAADGTVLMVNQTELTWLGYTRDELIGRPFTDVLTAPSRRIFQEHFPLFLQRGWVRDLEFELIRNDGTTFPVLLSATTLYDDAGAFLMSRSTMFDITERKETEAALRESQADLQDVLDMASDLIQSLDAAGTIQYVNSAWCETLGYTAAEVHGRSVFEVIDPTAHDHCHAVLHTLQDSGQTQQLELILRTKAGQKVVVEGSVSVRRRGDGRVTTNGVFRDMTRHKQAEEALRIANAEMERALRMKDEFLANMSHELRTPLNAILAVSETLLDGGVYDPLNERQQTALHRIETSGQHLLALINDILDLSKVEAGRLDLQIESIQVIDVCRASLQFVKELALKKQLRLDFQLSDELATMDVDPKRLKQMLVNLLSNAVKFTPPGGAVCLEVRPAPEAAVVCFAVRDTGIGIAPNDLTRLFRPFAQVDSYLNRQHEGTGLGLALVRRLAELHGGAITVESELGMGSCFTIALPYYGPGAAAPGTTRVVEDAAHTAASMPTDEGQTQVRGLYTSPRSAGARILLVDDSEASLESTLEYLQAKGYQVIVARNGREALDLAETMRPDVILIDIQMPELDGLEATRRLRARPETATTPIIALTALAMPGDRERCLAAGADEYLSKPVSLSRLVTRIEQLRRT
ncbi:MAG: PAS domain S-box protein [Chloroflexales bacterium]|nr:PAS domain S-box protein [Chloroflexales bacterium]